MSLHGAASLCTGFNIARFTCASRTARASKPLHRSLWYPPFFPLPFCHSYYSSTTWTDSRLPLDRTVNWWPGQKVTFRRPPLANSEFLTNRLWAFLANSRQPLPQCKEFRSFWVVFTSRTLTRSALRFSTTACRTILLVAPFTELLQTLR